MDMSTDVVRTYLAGSIALDPVFVRLRARVFDPNKAWIRVENAVLSSSRQKLGPIAMRTLGSALGWELRPWTQELGSDDSSITGFFQALNKLDSWDSIQLNCLSEEEVALFRACAGKLGNKVFEFPFPMRVLSTPKSYKEYLEQRGQRTNKNQRRYMKGLAEAGLEFRREFTWQDVEQVLDSRIAEFDNGADYTKTPQFREFFKAFFAEMTAEKRLLGAGLFEGTKMVAYTLGFCNGPVFHCYQTAFNPAFKEKRAGALAIEKAIEYALDSGIQVVDFMNGDPYLEAFTKEVLPLKRIVVFSKRLKGRLLASLFGLRSR